jgi:acyl-CoA dehydrogenase
MTEPEVASSDATNICTRIEREGDEYVINGQVVDLGRRRPPLRVYITMGKTDPKRPHCSRAWSGAADTRAAHRAPGP